MTSVNSLFPLELPDENDLLLYLQMDVESAVTRLIEAQNLQVVFGENYYSLGAWLHAESSSLPFLTYLYNNLLEFGVNGEAYYEALNLWSIYFF